MVHAQLNNTNSLRLATNGGTVKPVWGRGADGSNVLGTDLAFANALNTPASLTDVAAKALYQIRGDTIRPTDFSGTNDRAKLQATLDYCIANGYKTIVLERVYNLTGGGLPYQTVYEGGAGLTSFTLTYSGQTTGSIAAAATAGTVQTALEALSNIAVGEVVVTGTASVGYTVKFQAGLANTTAVMTATPTGGTGTVTVTSAAVSIDKAVWSDRNEVVIRGTAGGGITKTDSGFVFTSGTASTGDIAVENLKLSSTEGNGAALFDGDKLIRLTIRGNFFDNWDYLVKQTISGRWVQSTRVLANKIIGGGDMAVLCRESYDLTIAHNLVEDRAGGLVGNSEAMAQITNRNLRVSQNCIENCTGIPIQLATCWTATFDANYFELNGSGAASNPLIDLHTLVNTISGQNGVTFSSNTLQLSTAQKTANTAAVLLGRVRPTTPVQYTSMGNINDGGIMFKFGHATEGLMMGSGDYSENSGLVVYPGQENRYFTPGGHSSTTSARPKNPRIGLDTYFDTTLNKLITPKTVGVKTDTSIRFNAGATSSGTIALTVLGVAYTGVAVTAGDTITQVRDKVVAAAATYFPTWTVTAFSTDQVSFVALVPGVMSGANSLSAGATGVTQNYFGVNVAGVDPVWVEHGTVLSATATLDFPSIAAAGQQELTITVTGAATGDLVSLAPPAALEAGVQVTGYVSAANTVKVRLSNVTAAPIDPASASWKAMVIR